MFFVGGFSVQEHRKVHSGAVSIEKDKYLTPAHSLKSTRSSYSGQYCRYHPVELFFSPDYSTVE